MKKIIKKIFVGEYLLALLFGLVLIISSYLGFSFARKVELNFWKFFIEMISFLPFMFILIGIIDVWFPKEKIEKHIGKESGLKGMFLVILLAMFQAGPLYGAFPVAHILWKKGSSIKNIFIYIGAFSTIKIPMLTFEIGFLGLKFSILRTLFTLPVFIIIAQLMEMYLKNKNFEVKS